MGQLAGLIRSKYPGDYDDVDDDTLEKSIVAKYPEYREMMTPPKTETITPPAPIRQPVVNQSVPEERSMLRRGWEAISEPLTTVPSQIAKSIADPIDAPTLDRSPREAWWRGLGAGAMQGIGDVVSSMTSPIDLAATLLTGGGNIAAKQGAKGLAKVLTTGGRIASAPVAAHGATEVLRPDATMSERAFGLAEIAGGAAGMLPGAPSAKIPEIEPPVRPTVNRNIINQINPDRVNPTGMSAEAQAFSMPESLPVTENPDLFNPFKRDAALAGERPEGTVFNTETGKVEPSTGPRATPEQVALDRQRINEAVTHGDTVMAAKYGEDFKTKMTKEMENEYSLLKENHYIENSASDPNPFGDEPIATTSKVLIPELVSEGAPPIREKTGNFFIDDAARMEDEALSRRADPVQAAATKAKNDEWNSRQYAMAVSEGQFQEPNTRALTDDQLTPEQLTIKQSADKVRQHSQEYGSWFSEQENLLPEGEFFKPPPEIEAKYRAEHDAMQEAHRKLVDEYLEKNPTRNVTPKSDALPAARTSQLPRELQGAKPRFNIGQNTYTPIFDNDIDKALYIIAQEAPSKSNAKYLEWVMKETGLSNVEAMKKGQELRAHIKNVMKGQPDGDVPVPAFFEPTGPAPKTIPMTPREAFDQKYKRYQELVDRASQKHVDLTAAELAEARQLDAELRALDFKPPADTPTTPTTPKLMSKVTIKANKMTPEVMKQMKQAGYKFVSEDAAGNSTWVPDPKGPAKNLPILESEVGSTRPTQKTGELTDQMMGKPGRAKKRSLFLDAINIPRTMMATFDLSGPLRQGLALIHRPEFYKALPTMLKSYASEDGFKAAQKAISDRALFRERINPRTGRPMKSFAEHAGLDLTDLGSLSTREETFMSTLAEKIPLAGRPVRASNRAYTAFLNKLRADTFEALVNESKVFNADGFKDIGLARELADFINTSTGRGSLGKLERAAVVFNSTLFAPRLMAARLKMLDPRFYVMGSKIKRREAIKNLFAIATVGNVLTRLPQMAGIGTVSNDPSSSDFGKLKIGDTRLDPYGGFQQYIVAANRLMNPMGPASGFEGKTPFTRGQMFTSSTNPRRTGNLWKDKKGPYDPTHMDVLSDFVRFKEHPALGFVHSLMDNKTEASGRKMKFDTMNPFENSVLNRFMPIFLQDVYEMAENDELPPAAKAALLTGEFFGMSSQTYTNKKR